MMKEEIHFSKRELQYIQKSHQQAKEGKMISSEELYRRLRDKYLGKDLKG